MSKRIMNEMMCLEENMGMQIYHQDTDSMHIPRDSVGLLANTFKNKFNRELTGRDSDSSITTLQVRLNFMLSNFVLY